MADYHTVYKGPEGETTQWEDLQRKFGNLPAKAPVWKPQGYAPQAERRPDRAWLDGKDEAELEELDDEFRDDAFLEQYRCVVLTLAAAAPPFPAPLPPNQPSLSHPGASASPASSLCVLLISQNPCRRRSPRPAPTIVCLPQAAAHPGAAGGGQPASVRQRGGHTRQRVCAAGDGGGAGGLGGAAAVQGRVRRPRRCCCPLLPAALRPPRSLCACLWNSDVLPLLPWGQCCLACSQPPPHPSPVGMRCCPLPKTTQHAASALGAVLSLALSRPCAFPSPAGTRGAPPWRA